MAERPSQHPNASVITPPDHQSRAAARERLDALAKPVGSLGRLEDLAAWLAGCQGQSPPRRLDRVRAVVFAGDHGIARYGVSAYPQQVTPAMVRAFCAGTAAASVLARQHGIVLQIYDLAVDDELDGVPDEVTRHKVRRGSEPIQLADALTDEEGRRAWAAGVEIGEQVISAGTDLVIIGDLGIGNTTPASCLIAAALGLPAEQVTGRGTGLDDQALQHKIALVDTALRRVGSRAEDPWQRLLALGSADLTAAVATMITAARGGVPILLDGLIAVAEAVTAEALAPGLMAWCAAGHRSTEPAQRLALEKYGLEPVLDASMRLGEGSGALAAVPLLRSAALVINEMALITDLA
jgi:nicotinate-nucleotide--dimethylbenzimidazole phosphoribosyltransferase